MVREHGAQERDESGANDGERATAKPAVAPGPGLRAVQALDAPTPAAVAAIFAAHPDEHAAIAGHVQQTFGNRFALDVVKAAPAGEAPATEPTADATPAVDRDGPLGEPSGLAADQAAADQIAAGQHDESAVTNEVFWQLYPTLRGVKLRAGTPAATAWLAVRDDTVRPALKAARHPTHADVSRPAAPTAAVAEPDAGPAAHDAPLTVANHDDAGAAGIRAAASERPVVAGAVATAAADLQALFDWTPSGEAGERGEAAWLLAAIATGLIDAHGGTKTQLTQMMQGDALIHSTETEPGEKHRKHVDGVTRTKAGHYDVAVGDAPILGVLVALADSRLREWAGSGAKTRKHLFTLGTLVRGDVGFGGSQHTRGNAIDLGGMNFSNDKDVLALLDGLPPGKVDKVFADNNDHVHVTVNDAGNFELGFPFQGNFFARDEELPLAQKAAEKAAGEASDGATIHAEGMERYGTHWYKATGTFKAGAWAWSKKVTGKARHHLQSAKLKALLDTLDRGADSSAAVKAAHEDGHAPPAHHDH